jgi:predicted DNA-binding protein with PD1-like motif
LAAFYFVGVKLEYKRSGNFIVIRLDEGDRIIESIEKICHEEGVTSGVIITAVGALKECKLIFRRGCQGEFHEHFEIIGNGNISVLDGKPKVHLHISGGNDSKQVSGHLVEGVVTVFCEVIIQALQGFRMEREKDASLVSQQVLNPYVLKP